MKRLCSQPDCFGTIDVALDIVTRLDGTPHRLSLICDRCITDAQRKSLKRYKKMLRHRANKLQ